ncbi:MAG: tRNA pseudouridine(38-40) synthase TruA [Clostridiales bacterium]|nr:tRNA pseudouridine(38-40) synthase TruA [Clostridiales bacterium]
MTQIPNTTSTRRILLTISYDGTAYAGWQRQLNAMAVQQCIEEALCKLTNEKIVITGASRTDSGVHALGQRAHFDTASRIPADRFAYALNNCLPFDIRITSSTEVASGFHARYDAKGKRYTYRIHNAPHASAMYRHLCAYVPYQLNIPLMQEALTSLLGTHDFTAFQSSGGTAKTTIRTLSAIDLTCHGSDLVLTVEGNAFLYNMVRIIVGTMLDIGMERIPPNAFDQALQTGDRRKLGVTAPACGLELTEVFYSIAQ